MAGFAEILLMPQPPLLHEEGTSSDPTQPTNSVVTPVTRRITFPFVTVINRLKLLKKCLGSALLFDFLRQLPFENKKQGRFYGTRGGLVSFDAARKRHTSLG
jgi:hypothetical protein